jgi:hypothetical protein
MIAYTYDAWFKEFEPIPNHITKYPDILHFETYGEEYEFVKAQDPNHVWTEVDADEGTYIVAGWHYVNRIHYYITNKPWNDDIEVPTWIWTQCSCVEDDGEANPNCTKCEEGMTCVPTDTMLDLKQIYGERVKIVE